MIEIRECYDRDFDEILVLLRQLWPDKPIDPVSLKAVFEKTIASTSRTYYVAITERQDLIGLVSLSVKDSLWQEGLVAHVEELIVHEEARGKGVATALLKHAITLAQDRGCRRIELDSAHHRKTAHRLYERIGFNNRAALFSMAL